MKIFSQVSVVALTLLTATGFCDSSYQSNDHEQRIQALENRSKSCPGQKGSDTIYHSVHGCMSGFSIEGEFLWWRAHLDSLDYAVTANTPLGPPGPESKGRIHEPNFKYDPGVRVSAGYDFGKNNWDIFLRWTYHYTNPTSRVSIDPATETLAPIRDFASPSGIPAFTFADAARVIWQNRLNALDFEMGYDYFYSKRFSIRPNMGIKAAWIDMEYRTHLTDVIAIDPNPNVGNVFIKNKSDYWGVGPSAGIDGYLHIGWGFSLYGTVSGALLYGQFDTSYHQFSTNPDLADFTISLNDYFRQRAMAQFILGLEWAWCFSGDYLLALHVGWEGQYWWNQNEFRYAHEAELSGDLTYTGLDVGVRFDF